MTGSTPSVAAGCAELPDVPCFNTLTSRQGFCEERLRSYKLLLQGVVWIFVAEARV